jgi:hypothetical protein
MSVSFMNRYWAFGALAVVVGLGSFGSPVLKGSRGGPTVTPPATAAVQTVAGGTERIGARPGEKGATYYSLESQSTRVTTEFLDGSRSIGERGVDGSLKAVLTSEDGGEIHRLHVDTVQTGGSVLSFVPANGQPRVYRVAHEVHPTLDWLNHQAHKLHRDRVTSDTALEWKAGLMRPADAPTSDASDLDADVRLVETVWSNGLSARTTRQRPSGHHEIAGRTITGDVLATKVLRDGVDIGAANYFVNERIYAWHLQDVPDGWIADEHLQVRYGGWPFRPDMIWMNLQTIAKYHWRAVMNEKGFVARGGCSAPQPTLATRISSFFVPTLLANDPGCDDFHYFDGTLFRYCCDLHDACYEKAGCTSSTWWQWWSSWTCDFCNMNVIACVATGGGTNKVFFPCAC